MPAIQAVFADYKRVKSRKVHQIIFEVPSEQWQAAYKVLGEPSIETSDWFGIAPMNVSEPAPTPTDEKKNYAANAALMIKEVSFRRFLAEPYAGFQVFDADMANEELKQRLGVNSKSELNTNAEAAERWRDLRAEYHAWMNV